jgi:anti-sigma factor ChrR (cupin superfamily)
MKINADFTKRAVIETAGLDWNGSPVPGVERKYLDRVGGEIAKASSIVRYAPNSSFPKHSHAEGEEILVLEGAFSDEQGVYPAGTYLRNPPHSAHSPFSLMGCTLFVKLRQFHPDDDSSLRIDTNTTPWLPGLVAGLSVMHLHHFGVVGTALVRWEPNTIFNPHVHPGGEEIYVLEGVFHDEHGSYPKGTWIRSPRYSRHAPFTKSQGAVIYVKTGHLDHPLKLD